MGSRAVPYAPSLGRICVASRPRPWKACRPGRTLRSPLPKRLSTGRRCRHSASMRLLLLLLSLALAAPAMAGELKLATWNLAWLTLRQYGDPELPRGLPVRAPGDLDLLARYARRLDADVVALQEVDGPEAAARVFDPGTYTFFFPAEQDIQRTGFAVRRGLRATQNADLEALDLRPKARFSLRRGTDITVEAGGGSPRVASGSLNGGCRGGG